MANNVVSGLFRAFLFIQTILFFGFVVLNINNLNNVPFAINLNGQTSTYNLSMYSIIVVLGVLLTIAILVGVNLFGFGLNDTGTANVLRYLGLIILFSILQLSTAFFILPFGWVGIVVEIFILIVNLLWILNTFMSGENANV